MLFEQLPAAIACRKIQRIFPAHVAGDSELSHERFQAGDGIEAGAIGPCGALEAIGFTQLLQRLIDFPQQHRGRGRGAAVARQLAIDDDHVQALPRQSLGDQRSRNAGADNECITFEIIARIEA